MVGLKQYQNIDLFLNGGVCVKGFFLLTVHPLKHL